MKNETGHWGINKGLSKLGEVEGVCGINVFPNKKILEVEKLTLYPNGYININQNGEYTKHYYADEVRIASKIGSGYNTPISYNADNSQGEYALEMMKNDLGVLTGDNVDNIMHSLDTINYLTGNGNTEDDLFFYHGNHLSSTQMITDINANVVQQVLYAPFGEIITEYNAYWKLDTIPRFLFNAKELDEESGMYYYEARYYAPPTFISRDPLFEEYPTMSPYAYCANNPVKYIDPTGMEWVDGEGNKITDHSNIKVYIFYDPKSFGSQSDQMYKDAVAKYGEGSVAMSNVTTTADFKQDWGDMASGDIKEVNLNYHGSPRTINLDHETNQYLTSTGNGKTPMGNPATNISDLPTPSGNVQNAQLNINSCRSNDVSSIPKGSSTVAQSFRDNTSFHSIRTTEKNVSYWNWFSPNRPHPQDNSSWKFLYRPIPQRNPGVGLPPK